ncbi:hypothetical protein CHS0354_040325 [Potamilus streckersoni]|uniref:Uncharacterized protein n=1 Tax=Potamilus streckersoni TaxID=2493646 RepID=A0AAE0SGN4_9BIVA|nr:hypothetical protein CHS0354_040325 [Potamilus streckersoni]
MEKCKLFVNCCRSGLLKIPICSPTIPQFYHAAGSILKMKVNSLYRIHEHAFHQCAYSRIMANTRLQNNGNIIAESTCCMDSQSCHLIKCNQQSVAWMKNSSIACDRIPSVMYGSRKYHNGVKAYESFLGHSEKLRMHGCSQFGQSHLQSRQALDAEYVCRVMNPRKYSTDQVLQNCETLEQKLLFLMKAWEMEKAVKLLRISVQNGDFPSSSVVLNLLQQLANLGEVECLLSLHTLLLEEKLCTEQRLFDCLQNAYYNSGRIEEGVGLLKILYHKTRKYADVDIFFTLVAVMILKEFPHRRVYLEEFVQDCKEMGDTLPAAGLWKSYILAEKFNEAEAYMFKESEAIMPHIPQMVSEIVSRKNKVVANRRAVLHQLTQLPPIKSKLKAAVYLAYISELCFEEDWKKALETFQSAEFHSLSISIHKLQELYGIISEQNTEYPEHATIETAEARQERKDFLLAVEHELFTKKADT